MHFSNTDSLVAIVALAFACHGVFKYFEPRRLMVHFILLVLVPGASSSFLFHHRTVTWAVTLTFAIYLSTLCLSVVAYRLSPYHPLSKYPGPVLARVTKLWSAWIAMGGKQHLCYQRLHKEYGDIVRVGPNELSFCDVNAVNPIMGTNGMPKGPYWEGRIPTTITTRALITQRYTKEHTRRRRPWNRAFSTSALKEYETTLAGRITQLADKLEEHTGAVDLSLWICYFAYDFMGDMAFGGGTELIRDGDTNGLWHMLEDPLPISNVFGHLPWSSAYWEKIPGANKSMNDLRDFAIRRAIERRKQGSQKNDLFHHLIDEDSPNQTPMPEVVSDAVLAIIAGSDTTSTTLSNIFWLLLSNPTSYSLLQKEVDMNFPSGANAFDTGKYAEMGYLNAVINETIRLYPVVPTGSQRAPQKGSGGHIVGEHFLPEGTTAFVHFYSLQRDPRYFSPSPDDFLPERFLASADERSSSSSSISSSILSTSSSSSSSSSSSTTTNNNNNKFIHNPAAFIPFSYGPANCVGKALALMEVRMVVCHLMQTFEMRFSKEWDGVRYGEDLRDHYVMGKGELWVVLTRRKGN